MKIVTWNCNGALRNKTDKADELNADVLVIQECESPAESTEEYRKWAGDYLWIGTSKNKGIGVFSKNKTKVKKLEWYGEFEIPGLSSRNSSVKWNSNELNLFLPFTVNDEFTLLAIWTKGSDKEVFSYVGQFWKYLQIHKSDLNKDNVIVLGDLNSNSCWDKPDRWWNHSDIIFELADIGIESIYHKKKSESQGQEKTPTFFMHKKNEKPYHIDYVFCSKNIMEHAELQIGEFHEWISTSDHMPLVLNLK